MKTETQGKEKDKRAKSRKKKTVDQEIGKMDKVKYHREGNSTVNG